MAMRSGARQPVGSEPWCAEERSSAREISRSEVEEFTYSARNELEWLNEHMADIFSENQINVAEVFKTPGKLRGRTPRTAHRFNNSNTTRAPLSNLFSATPKGSPNPFTASNLYNARPPSFRIAEDKSISPEKPASITRNPIPAKSVHQDSLAIADSGYYGSQNQDVTINADDLMGDAAAASLERKYEGTRLSPTASVETVPVTKPSPATDSVEEVYRSAKKNRVETADCMSTPPSVDQNQYPAIVPPSSPVQLLGNESPKGLQPETSLKTRSTPREAAGGEQKGNKDNEPQLDAADGAANADENAEDLTRSPSDGSSPIRPLVRKSSLNFASLPAREPLTSNKSIGSRMSRISHIDQNRTSYYPRQTGGKSLGVRQDAFEDGQDAMDVDENHVTEAVDDKEEALAAHSKTYTQRLQDQISMLGKSQVGGMRTSKSIPNAAIAHQSLSIAQSQTSIGQTSVEQSTRSPVKLQKTQTTPGAVEEDDDDDWIAPPTTKKNPTLSPRPGIGKSHTTDIMEGIRGNTVAGDDFEVFQMQTTKPGRESPRYSPQKPPTASHSTSISGHSKSVSVPDLLHQKASEETREQDESLRKVVSVFSPMEKTEDVPMAEVPKSPSRVFRESPLKNNNTLKNVKDKFSSILKGSKGLLASSAALSAEGKASLVNTPSTARMHKRDSKSCDSSLPERDSEPLYPDLTRHMSPDSQPAPSSSSPSRSKGHKIRVSSERDKREQKQKDKDDKEAQHIADQMERLEKAREKEREKARDFSKEQQERHAAEKHAAAQKMREKNTQTPAPKDVPKPTRTSPRKAKTQPEVEGRAFIDPADSELDVEMADGPPNKTAPPSIPRPTPGSTLKSRDIKRPIKPTREAITKSKQAPTLIRVNTSSQHGGFQPSNSVLASTLQDTLTVSQHQAKNQPSQPSLQTKPSLQSLKSSVSSSTGRPKALELAAKRKQQEEREAQRKRDFKAEIERKREEDRRQEEARREKERQRLVDEAEAKKNAERQAAIERAKQTRAPPPAVRPQPNGPLEYGSVRSKTAVPRPPSRLQQSLAHRSQEDVNRPVNAVLSNATKMSVKRPLQQEATDDGIPKPTGSKAGPSQQKEVKRMRLSDEFDVDEEMEIQSYGTSLKGPPVRPSAGLKKDVPNKSLFSSGFTAAPQGVTRDIFNKAPVAAHHSKGTHPLDMAQVSKGPIPFASSQHTAGPSHKTPARPAGVTAVKSAAKSAARSSPRFQNGDNIELPEIQTDDEDEDEEDESRGLGVASWADTPELRRELMKQETIDPLQVFGPPAPLRLEEVFKNKDRWNKFRARTSSANWSGTDRLTEDEIRKDIAARERMRRDGGWSYELSKDMA